MPRPYPKEFREGAIELARRGERPMAEIAHQRRAARAHRAQAPSQAAGAGKGRPAKSRHLSGLRKSRRSLTTSSLGHVHRELDDLESEDLLEPAVSGRESESVLFAQSRDPDVVLLYRNAGLPE